MRVLLALLLLFTLLPDRLAADEAIDALVEVLLGGDDPQLDADILKGVRDGLAGTRKLAAPKHWDAVARRLRASPSAEVRELTRELSLKFGSQAALEDIRRSVFDARIALKDRRAAWAALQEAGPPDLRVLAMRLLDEPALRVDAIRALGRFNDDAIAGELIARYLRWESNDERRACLSVLVSRPVSARKLLDAVGSGAIPVAELTAEFVRQLRELKDPNLNARVTKVWGLVRDRPEEKRREIARFKKLLADGKGDAGRGHSLFKLICAQCHTLFGEGGKVGPDITGANRADLDYLLHNILDPNAEIPNDYRTTNVELKDERSLTGIVARQDSATVTLITGTETLTLARGDIVSLRLSELSMMPDGLLQALDGQQTRDLIAFLQRTSPD